MNLKQEQYFVYAWRYVGDEIACKIGHSCVGAFWGRTAPARTNDYRDIEILGIQLCDSKAEASSQEKCLRNERFERFRPDREWICLTNDVRDWIKTDCIENPPQLKEFDVCTNHRQGQKGEERNITERARQRKKRAKEKFDAEEYETALKGFNGVLELKPNDAEAHLYCGIARYKLEGALDGVITHFDEAIRLKPDLAKAYLYRGMCKVLLADYNVENHGAQREDVMAEYDKAMVDFDKATQLKPDLAAAYAEKGHLNIGLKKYEDAIANFDEAIRIEPNKNWGFWRIVAKLELNRLKKANKNS